MDRIKISTEYIKLDQFLKWAGIADTGAIAKIMILNGDVNVNGMVSKERGKKLRKGDIIEVKDIGSFEII